MSTGDEALRNAKIFERWKREKSTAVSRQNQNISTKLAQKKGLIKGNPVGIARIGPDQDWAIRTKTRNNKLTGNRKTRGEKQVYQFGRDSSEWRFRFLHQNPNPKSESRAPVPPNLGRDWRGEHEGSG